MADGESETLRETESSASLHDGASKRVREDEVTDDNAGKKAKLDSEKAEEPEKSLEPSGDDCASKRAMEVEDEETENNADKKAKADSEKALAEDPQKSADDAEMEPSSVTVGPKTFITSVEMFDYFYKLLHAWPPNIDVNKYEHMMLLELLKKGHAEADRKIGKGIKAFQVRFHPQFKSRCFFLLREDDSVDDFSFRKCVNHILPLPESMQLKHDANKALRAKGRSRGRGRGRGGR